MGRRPSGAVIRPLHAIHRAGTVDGLSDAQLLERLILSRGTPGAASEGEAPADPRRF
jgi:hypothetical protein